MEIVIAKHAGFCEGVDRAFQIALETARSGRQVFMLGNLVHNKQVVDKLKSQGIRSVSSLTEIPSNSNGVLLISAHGVPPEVYYQAKNLKLEIIDTTCPWVKKAQKLAKQLADEGCVVVIVGDKGHAEVRGLIGWSGEKAVVAETLDDIKHLRLTADLCVGMIAQTTQAEDHFQKMAAALKQKVSAVKIHNTICGATYKRQSTAVEVAGQVDLMLVIGDQMSANTKRLTELCAATGTETHQIQTVKELNKNWLKGQQKVGVTAGASTPEWVIEEVIEELKRSGGL